MQKAKRQFLWSAVSWKQSNMDQYLPFDSHHPVDRKLRTPHHWAERGNQLCEPKDNECNHLRI